MVDVCRLFRATRLPWLAAVALALLLQGPGTLAFAQTSTPTPGTPVPSPSVTPECTGTPPSTPTTTPVPGNGSAAMALSLTQAAPGTTVAANVSGFQAGETIQFILNSASLASATADTSKNAAASFAVPSIAAGTYEVTAVGQTSNTKATA